VEGEALLASGGLAEAKVLLEPAVKIRTEALDPLSPLLCEALMPLAECEWKLGHHEQARALRDRARRIVAGHAVMGKQYTEALRSLDLLFGR
jgi:hypothetical protein